MSDKMQGGIVAGSTSFSASAILRSSLDSTEVTGKVAADMTLSYWRQGGSSTTQAASDLSTVTSSWTAGGVKEVSSANRPGEYRVDWPDAAFATGADWVELAVKVAGCFVYFERQPLTTNVAQSANNATNISAIKTKTDSLTFTVSNQVDANALTDVNTSNVTAIKAKTDSLTFTVSNQVDANTLKIGGTTQTARDLGANVLVDATQAIPTSNTANTVGDCLNAARAQGFGKWAISGTTLRLYASDGTTVVRTFTLDSSSAPTSRT